MWRRVLTCLLISVPILVDGADVTVEVNGFFLGIPSYLDNLGFDEIVAGDEFTLQFTYDDQTPLREGLAQTTGSYPAIQSAYFRTSRGFESRTENVTGTIELQNTLSRFGSDLDVVYVNIGGYDTTFEPPMERIVVGAFQTDLLLVLPDDALSSKDLTHFQDAIENDLVASADQVSSRLNEKALRVSDGGLLNVSSAISEIVSIRIVPNPVGGTLFCDLDSDGDCDASDISLLYERDRDITEWLTQASELDEDREYVLGDTNLDGSVDSTDLGVLLNNFNGLEGPAVTWAGGDLNNSGNVDSTDLGLLLNNFNFTSASASAVPEPDSAVLILLGVFGLLARRRK